MDAKKVFLTGATGLLGGYIARKFLLEGYHIKALKRPGASVTNLEDIALKIEWIEGDIFDVEILQEHIHPADLVVHAAAMVSFSGKNLKQLYITNVEGTANLVNVCLEKNVRKFVYVSSVASLGRKKNQLVIDETNRWEESGLNTEYAKSKYLAELEVWRAIAEGLQAVIVNPSVILGNADWNKSSSQLFKYIHTQKPFYASGAVNWVDVRDVAEIIWLLAQSAIVAERFIVSAGQVTYHDLFSLIADCFKVRRPYIRITPLLAELAWRTGKLVSMFTQKAPLVTKETARVSRLKIVYNNQKIQETLAFKFRTLQETVGWACEEFLKNPLLYEKNQ